jgi:ankyrin repeat protein
MNDASEESNVKLPLHCVAAFCDRDTILKSLQRGADILAGNSNHRLALEVAIDHKNSKYLFIPLTITCCAQSWHTQEINKCDRKAKSLKG